MENKNGETVKDKPKHVENFTVDVDCENCFKEMKSKYLWVWHEHLACSRACVEACFHRARPELKGEKNE